MGGKPGGRLTGTGIWKVVVAIGAKVGVKTRPHGIRHVSITEAIKAGQKEGLGLQDILRFSRHADVRTLLVYYDGVRDCQAKVASLVSRSVIGK